MNKSLPMIPSKVFSAFVDAYAQEQQNKLEYKKELETKYFEYLANQDDISLKKLELTLDSISSSLAELIRFFNNLEETNAKRNANLDEAWVDILKNSEDYTDEEKLEKIDEKQNKNEENAKNKRHDYFRFFLSLPLVVLGCLFTSSKFKK